MECNPAGIEVAEPSSRVGVMAFKGGGMRTLVRAHDEVPCITAIITPEIRRRIAQHARMECNPAGIEVAEPSSRVGVMAFKGGGMRTLVRAHTLVRVSCTL
jgi:hypothetical protein